MKPLGASLPLPMGVILIVQLLAVSLRSETLSGSSDASNIVWSVTPFFEYRVSEYVLEGPPDRDPGLDLFAGTARLSNGFRLFTNSRVPMYGLKGAAELSNHRFVLAVSSSAGRIRKGDSGDYDFYGHPWISVRDNASQPLSDFRDTNHVTVGAYNWSMSWSDLTRKEDRIDFEYHYGFQSSALVFGLHYAYWKDRFVDGPPFYVQHSAAFLVPRGRSLSLANNQYLISAAYRYDFRLTESWSISGSIGLLSGWTTVTDYHPYRSLHAYSSTLGWGAELSLGISYDLATNHSLALAFSQERYYSSGKIESRGGFSFEDRLMSLVTVAVYINYATKTGKLEYTFRF